MHLSGKILQCSLYMTPKKCYHEWNLRILKNLCYKSATNFSITVWGVSYAQSMNWPGKLRRSIVVNVTHTLMLQKFCDHPYSGCRRNSAITHTLGQKFCGHLYTGRRRNSVSTLTLDIAEICDHWYTGCGRNSTTFYKMDVAEILQRFIHWVLQKFCDHSYTGCSRNSTTTLIHWM